jgi:hypothetical protein
MAALISLVSRVVAVVQQRFTVRAEPGALEVQPDSLVVRRRMVAEVVVAAAQRLERRRAEVLVHQDTF